MPVQNEQAEGVLGRWYAEPLDTAQAQQLVHRVEQSTRRTRPRRIGLCHELARLRARFWLGHPVDSDYSRLSRRAGDNRRARALVELICGQLLMSRRIEGAMAHLEGGFRLAQGLLSAHDYLLVLRRHQRLAYLPLGTTAHPSQSLMDLLRVAAVIERMAPRRTPPGRDPHDLYG